MSMTDSPRGTNDSLNMDDLEALFDEASESLSDAVGETAGEHPEGMRPFSLGDLSPSVLDATANPIGMLDEVEMDLRIELGRTQMRLEDVLRLRPGSVVMLDKLASDPVDIFANGQLIARGEVLVMNDHFCVRVTELLGSPE
ncbi:flagellar motor switch protein FliN [Allorhodopirellula solitaria]|uniref:Flagellar motor switch protein FliN n=1 Tax=Allorhodopirellula solitaria TaxID=2527987 RepID=A0A5C5YI38_9BACT|nr:flagellar motor switch protein FliN [Allorhodopirellula solitaria]TWT74222.1 Flagellar motor switch protein FliN [Allorhodopirellula solitaria]